MHDMQEMWVWSLGHENQSPGGGNGNPFQYSCLENLIDRRAWWVTVHGITESDMTEQLNWTEHLDNIETSYPRIGAISIYLISTFLVTQTVKNLPIMQETWVWSLSQEDPLEKGMVTHSNILAWRIPWTEEPGGLQFMGSQRVEHDEQLILTQVLRSVL